MEWLSCSCLVFAIFASPSLVLFFMWLSCLSISSMISVATEWPAAAISALCTSCDSFNKQFFTTVYRAVGLFPYRCCWNRSARLLKSISVLVLTNFMLLWYLRSTSVFQHQFPPLIICCDLLKLLSPVPTFVWCTLNNQMVTSSFDSQEALSLNENVLSNCLLDQIRRVTETAKFIADLSS